MGALRTPREKWVEEGLRALAEGGVEAVRIEALAKGASTATSPTATRC
jgi:DNA-binding transcriptional regulator YbjK